MIIKGDEILEIQILKMSRKYRSNALPSLFCHSSSSLCDSLLKGVLIIKFDVDEFVSGDNLVIIDNPSNLSKDEIFSHFNFAQVDDIKMEVVPEYILNFGEFIPFDEYKKSYFENQKKHRQKNIIKRMVKKDYEVRNKVFTKEELNKLYESLNLPQVSDINKSDFLEYSLYFDTNLKHYEILKNLKSKDISWKEFKDKDLHNIRVRDINVKDDIVTIGHTTSNVTKNLFSSKQEPCRD